jgi:hypothetical protein
MRIGNRDEIGGPRRRSTGMERETVLLYLAETAMDSGRCGHLRNLTTSACAAINATNLWSTAKNAGDEFWPSMKKTLLLVFVHGFKVQIHMPFNCYSLTCSLQCDRAATTPLPASLLTSAHSSHTPYRRSRLFKSSIQSLTPEATCTSASRGSKNGTAAYRMWCSH